MYFYKSETIIGARCPVSRAPWFSYSVIHYLVLSVKRLSTCLLNDLVSAKNKNLLAACNDCIYIWIVATSRCRMEQQESYRLTIVFSIWDSVGRCFCLNQHYWHWHWHYSSFWNRVCVVWNILYSRVGAHSWQSINSNHWRY